MITRSLVLTTSDPAWPTYLNGTQHDVYHLPAYLQAEDDFRGDTSKLVVVSDAKASLVVPLTFKEIPGTEGSLDASSPYGYPAPLISADADGDWIDSAIESLLSHLRGMGVVSLFLRFHPLLGIRPEVFARFGVQVQQGPTVAVVLGRPFEAIKADMRKGHRYDIRKALREGQRVEWDENWNYFEHFLEIYRQTMDRVGAGEGYYFSREYFERLRDDLADHVSLWVTKIDDEVAAASLITECGGIAQYHLSGTRSDFLGQYPTKALLEAAANWANKRGNSFFHLGGGLGGQEDSLFRFKAGFSKERQTFSTVRIVVDQEKFSHLVSAWERENDEYSGDLSGYFPPYLKLST